MLECDVLIVGCGPAGASLAYYLTQKNIKVIVAEKKKNLDTPVRCAGFVPVNVAGLFDFKISGINNQTKYLETYAANNPLQKFKLISKTIAPGFILDRDIFINDIASRFTKAGGNLLKGTKVLSVRQLPEGFILELIDIASKNHLILKARIIAGADGPLSLIGRLAGSVNKSFMPAIQQSPLTVLKSIDCNKVFFSPYISCGYGWLFPKTESVNLGVGAFPESKTVQSAGTGVSLKDTLSLFTRHLEFSGIFADNLNPRQSVFNNSSTPAITGLIADSGIVENRRLKDGYVLCGDAAGLCNPTTGAGIHNAIYSARLASESIAKSLNLNDLNILQEIKETYDSQFGNSINRALNRKLIQKNDWPQPLSDRNSGPQAVPNVNNNAGYSPSAQNENACNYKDGKDNIEFLNLIRQTWVSFKEYWR